MRMPLTTVVSCCLAGLAVARPVSAEVRVNHLFSDHMVLQRGREVPVWGTADPGERVTVTLGRQERAATAGPDGQWTVRLAELEAGGPFELKVAGQNTITVEDVLVGEVWFCSGQSNMDFTVARTEKRYFAGVADAEREIAAADHPRIRMFTSEWTMRDEPQADVEGRWVACSPRTVGDFSAVAYFFGRHLHEVLDVPVGLITSAYGASTAQAWTSRAALDADPQLRPLLEAYAAACAAYTPELARQDDEAYARWQQAAETARSEGKPAPRAPKRKDPHQDQHNPSVLFNGMVAPVIPYGIRGAIWYQGESNTAALYPRLQATLIRDWRRRWGQGDFPFLFVQLASLNAPPTEPGNSRLAAMREAQATSLALPQTGMAVTIDIGEAKDVHPRNKQDVGRRLALIAEAQVYGRSVTSSGPVFESMSIEGRSARIRFRHTEGGLVAQGGTLAGFAIAGKDGTFAWADARIDGETVVVSSPRVEEPAIVRYAWADNPPATLSNGAGLPARPFRTDEPDAAPVSEPAAPR
jgi:sialate O-acetylesterase